MPETNKPVGGAQEDFLLCFRAASRQSISGGECDGGGGGGGGGAADV
jgi:hypothetical protein